MTGARHTSVSLGKVLLASLGYVFLVAGTAQAFEWVP